MENERFIQELQRKKDEAEGYINGLLPAEESFQKTLFTAMNYSVQNGGKRLRPIMMLASYRFFGGAEEQVGELVAPFLAAMEMIHSYSLVHDDLPAMDNDRYRRGKLTTHAAYGEAMGILAGDGLLNAAYETALSAANKPENAVKVVKAAQILGKKAGAYGMVGGQVVDVKLTGKTMTAEQLDFIYRRKTGALLEASLMIGAVLADASDEQVAKMERVAADVGMAFQIQDDILDRIGNEALLGKPLHSDEKNEKTTFVTLNGMEASRKAVEELSERAAAALREIPGDSSFLVQLIEWLVKREY